MSTPRYDLIRADVDDLHAKHFAKSLDIKKSHKNFVKGLNKAFSPLTESTAFSYAKAAYHADIVHIEQYFNVEKNGCHYDVILMIAEKGAKYVSKKQMQKCYKSVDKAMETCRVLNMLFGVNLFEDHIVH